MSFSSQVKEELLGQTGNGRHCCIAEFAAIFALCGQVKTDKSGRRYLQISTENLTVAKKSDILLKNIFQVRTESAVVHHHFRSSGERFFLIVQQQNDIGQILKAIKMLDESGNQWGDFCQVRPLLVQNTCCKRAYLRGSFLVAGTVTDPKKSYHLEIAVGAESYAESLRELVAGFDSRAKLTKRKNHAVLYIKEGEQIVDFLNIIGAHQALMAFENVRIEKEVRNLVNRQVNCETANIGKTVTAAARQIEDIRYLQCHMGFSKLSDGLREVAILRLQYPDCSLEELGTMLSEPIGKSGVNHRLRKISKMAQQLREEPGGNSHDRKDD